MNKCANSKLHITRAVRNVKLSTATLSDDLAFISRNGHPKLPEISANFIFRGPYEKAFIYMYDWVTTRRKWLKENG